MFDQILRLIKTGWRVIKEHGTIHWLLILGIAISSSFPVWTAWDNDGFLGLAIGFSILVYAAVFLCVLGYLGYRKERNAKIILKVDYSNEYRIPLIKLFAEA